MVDTVPGSVTAAKFLAPPGGSDRRAGGGVAGRGAIRRGPVSGQVANRDDGGGANGFTCTAGCPGTKGSVTALGPDEVDALPAEFWAAPSMATASSTAVLGVSLFTVSLFTVSFFTVSFLTVALFVVGGGSPAIVADLLAVQFVAGGAAATFAVGDTDGPDFISDDAVIGCLAATASGTPFALSRPASLVGTNCSEFRDFSGSSLRRGTDCSMTGSVGLDDRLPLRQASETIS
jgi:hypothetical protein